MYWVCTIFYLGYKYMSNQCVLGMYYILPWVQVHEQPVCTGYVLYSTLGASTWVTSVYSLCTIFYLGYKYMSNQCVQFMYYILPWVQVHEQPVCTGYVLYSTLGTCTWVTCVNSLCTIFYLGYKHMCNQCVQFMYNILPLVQAHE